MSKQKEFGDFQTPNHLAAQVAALVAELFGSPDIVVEPTVGLGAFLRASHGKWGNACSYEGYEINPDYVRSTSRRFSSLGIRLWQQDFFSADWHQILRKKNLPRVLVLGNPPWVTNSEQGILGSTNLPKKANFQRLRGFDAKTGKSNFDIAEWMLIRLIEALPESGAIAMLCKTMTARKVLRHFWKTEGGFEASKLFRIDAKTNFGVAVDACLFVATGKRTEDRIATIYSRLNLDSKVAEFGWVDGNLVSDIGTYTKFRELDGGSPYAWRSGIKHDASNVMEFTRRNGHLVNGLGEAVELEEEYLYPLLKSSDLGNRRAIPRKVVLVTQRHTGDDTSSIRDMAPKTWRYLDEHSEKLDSRKSSIYQNRPRFSIFGIGEYSFAPWKVAISGLYKSFTFVVVPPANGRPVMVDDTCYSIPCKSEKEARLLYDLLNSKPAQCFLGSIVFEDSKRPITVDVLRRFSLVNVAKLVGRLDELTECMLSEYDSLDGRRQQLSLVIEEARKYQTRRRRPVVAPEIWKDR
ncbi:MAG: hypothetical protein OXL95_09600 [Nitrospira sp.]|nr:hypothetical protein [Nitrospira sp.]MDE0485879.1 hypothetical protein [Nitrospira sp.]